MNRIQPLMYIDNSLLTGSNAEPVDIPSSVTRLVCEAKEKSEQLPSLKSIISLYKVLRGLPGVWQVLISELLQIRVCSIAEIADEMEVSARTIKRILKSETMMPCIETSFRLFLLHLQWCPQRYRYVGQEVMALDERRTNNVVNSEN